VNPAKKNAVLSHKPTEKKPTAKKTTARKTVAKPKPKKDKAEAKGGRAKIDERFARQGAGLKKLVDSKVPLPEAAKKLGIAVGKAERLLARASLKSSELVTGTEAEIAKAIVRLHEEDGLPFVPDIWARVPGLSGAKIKELYELTKP
jgi:hypothetical protein